MARISEHDFGVRSDVDEELEIVPSMRSLGKDRAGGVGADMARDARQQVDLGEAGIEVEVGRTNRDGAVRREQVKSNGADDVERRVLERFGNPRQIARRLWWPAAARESGAVDASTSGTPLEQAFGVALRADGSEEQIPLQEAAERVGAILTRLE